MTIRFFSEEIVYRIKDKKGIVTLIRKIINEHEKTVGIINIILTSDKILSNLNKKYLNSEYLTDIITFDYSSEKSISGDLYISIERVKDNAAKYKIIIGNELKRVIIHGVLHLVGYKDKKILERKQMRIMEDRYLNYL